MDILVNSHLDRQHIFSDILLAARSQIHQTICSIHEGASVK
jgi:hypothetical protein